MPSSSGLGLRHLMTGVLVAGLALDVASRFLTYDRFVNRGWEAMVRQGPSGHGGVLEPNKRYESDRAFGDLSSMSNRPWMRQYHREVFTADAYGMRNAFELPGRPVAVMMGSSFTIGSTLSDDETVPAQLSRILGEPVYNAGGTDMAHLDEILDRTKIVPGGTLIVEFLEMIDPPRLADSHPPERTSWLRQRLGSSYWALRDLVTKASGWMAPSPFQIVLIHTHKALENDVVLPNTFAPLALEETLRNGDHILFLPLELSLPERDVDAGAEYMRHLANDVAARGLRTLAVLVPTQYTVYAPLLREPPGRFAGVDYLARLEAAMRRRGLATVNLTALLQGAARDHLAEHRYVFWRDDTHWNRDGARMAAEAIAAAMRAGQ